MELNKQLMQQLLETFKVELADQLQIITDGLLALEKAPADDVRQDTLNGIFRAAHNVKGASRGVGVSKVAEIAHRLEDMFSGLKQANCAPDAATIDLCLETLDHLRTAMTAHSEGCEPDIDLEDLYGRLEKAAQATTSATPGETAPATTSAPAAPQKPAAAPPPRQATDNNNPSQQGTGKAAPEVRQKPRTDTVEVIRVTTDKLDRVAALAEELQVTKISLEDQFATMAKLHSQVDHLENFWQRGMALLKRSGPQALPDDARQWLTEGMDSVRQVQVSSSGLHKSMRSSTSRLNFISGGLQGDVRMLRLVPAATLLQPLARSVRDIARDLGKQVDFSISGDDIELDRAVLEGLRDPLMHLLRNAIDHGLETTQQREQLGKPAAGTLGIAVSSAGGQIQLKIHDDGAGIDADGIAAIAVRKKLLKQEEADALDQGGRLDLIFRPGFSSKEIITDVSGRGVGLDVVAANLRELKGTVRLDTEVGKGSTFLLTVPLTLSTERGLLVRASQQTFVIPSIAVERILELGRKDIIDIEASQAILLDGRPLPLRDLATTLELERSQLIDSDRISVVIVSKGWQMVAFLVDEVIGEREIVIKRLRPPLTRVRNVSGATLTGNGDIVMVLNAGDLVVSALSHSRRVQWQTPAGDADAGETPHILVVDDSITTRTLERNILEAQGYRVHVATDGKEAWDLLQDQPFDLVVTDIEMPVMNGFELTERIKTSEVLGETPVIIVSSLSKDAEKKRGVEVGANAYIVKGQFETRALLDVVRQLI